MSPPVNKNLVSDHRGLAEGPTTVSAFLLGLIILPLMALNHIAAAGCSLIKGEPSHRCGTFSSAHKTKPQEYDKEQGLSGGAKSVFNANPIVICVPSLLRRLGTIYPFPVKIPRPAITTQPVWVILCILLLVTHL